MRVYKFGGASVKEPAAVKNIVSIVEKTDFTNGIIVVSAMGKTTNALENILKLHWKNEDWVTNWEYFVQFHKSIVQELALMDYWKGCEEIIQKTKQFLLSNTNRDKRFIYDQVVSTGELLSTFIISTYFKSQRIKNTYLDAREHIITNSDYQDAKINWKQTNTNISSLDTKRIYITQGFIGGNGEFTTTLGREGSDFSAAIFAHCTKAESLTVWKDVPGILSADPRHFSNHQLIPQLQYNDAIELAFYGASVIHPKTLQPLKDKNIPFYVRSFLDIKARGTSIGSEKIKNLPPIYILKKGLQLIQISTKDYSFIVEKHLGKIYHHLSENNLRAHLVQNSAISLTLCVQDKFDGIEYFKEELQDDFLINVKPDVDLLTIRNYTKENISTILQEYTSLVRMVSENTFQIVVKDYKEKS